MLTHLQSSENSKSLKVLEELLGKLNISKAQDEINSSAASIATFINGDIEEADAPTKYVASRKFACTNTVLTHSGPSSF